MDPSLTGVGFRAWKAPLTGNVDPDLSSPRALPAKEGGVLPMYRSSIVVGVLSFLPIVHGLAPTGGGDTSSSHPGRVSEAVGELNRLLAQESGPTLGSVKLTVVVKAEGSGVLPGATVVLDGLRGLLKTHRDADVDGEAVFEDLPPGLFLLDVSFPGYASSRRWILLLGVEESPALRRTVTLFERPDSGGLIPADPSSAPR